MNDLNLDIDPVAQQFVFDFIGQLEENRRPEYLALVVVRHLEACRDRASELLDLARLVYSTRVGEDLVWINRSQGKV